MSRESLVPIEQTGSLGVMHLNRLWSAIMAQRGGSLIERANEREFDRLLLDGLGVGLHQAMEFLFQTAPTWEQFEAWIVATAGHPTPEQIERINAEISGDVLPAASSKALGKINDTPDPFSADDLEFWNLNGYVVLPAAVSSEYCHEAAQAVYEYVGANPHDPASWYPESGHSIMVELIQHPALNRTRHATRIHKAFSQLWQTLDLWVTVDRCGFHPPQHDNWPFPGPDLHWDVCFAEPVPFATQGILYLTDTPAEQGALTLVPGFHRRLKQWLRSLPAGCDPQQQDLHALGSRPIEGRAGDLIIWHQALPHGSRPNLGQRPRVVQYINRYPGPTATAKLDQLQLE